jgi:hypothetical protein
VRRNAIVATGWLPITATGQDLRNGAHRLVQDLPSRSLPSNRRHSGGRVPPEVRKFVIGGSQAPARAAGACGGGGWRWPGRRCPSPRGRRR